MIRQLTVLATTVATIQATRLETQNAMKHVGFMDPYGLFSENSTPSLTSEKRIEDNNVAHEEKILALAQARKEAAIVALAQ